MPTVTIRKRKFESNTDVDPGSPFSTFVLANGSMNVFTTPLVHGVEDPANPGNFFHYRFLFWNLLDELYTSNTVTINNIGNKDFDATAWYIIEGAGNGRSHVRTSSFSITQNLFLPDTPIQSVDPNAAWASPTSKVVYTDNDVTANNTVIIDAKNFYLSEKFNGWIDLFGICSISGDKLTVQQNNSVFAMVTFKEAVPERIWLDELLYEIEDVLRHRVQPDPSPIDFTRLIVKLIGEHEPRFFEDDLYKLTEGITTMDERELKEAKERLDLQLKRMNTSMKVINEKLKSMKK